MNYRFPTDAPEFNLSKADGEKNFMRWLVDEVYNVAGDLGPTEDEFDMFHDEALRKVGPLKKDFNKDYNKPVRETSSIPTLASSSSSPSS